MKHALKVMLVLAICFASTFLLLKATGLVTIDKIEHWLAMAQDAHAIYVGAIVAGLLFADLFIAVPTLTVSILGGFFLGPVYGALAAILGLSMAGCAGYLISRRYGDLLIKALVREEQERQELKESFTQHGSVVILLSRAVPILPEVSACMAGMTRMCFVRFLGLWLVSTVPYSIIAAYAGSISSLQNPFPAIAAAIGLTVFFWTGWFLFKRKLRSAPDDC